MKRVLLCIVVALSLSATAQAAPKCEDWCAKRLQATERWQRWESQEQFSRRQGATGLQTLLLSRGHHIPYLFHGVGEPCRAKTWGRGVIVSMNICGDPTRILMRYRAVQNPRHFRLRYRATTN